MTVYFNDDYIDSSKAVLKTTDLSIQRGYAVFDFFRTINERPLFINEHLDRFFDSASAMHLSLKKSKEEISGIVHELIGIHSFPQSGIRLLLTGGYSADTYQQAEPNFMISCTPLVSPAAADYEKGYTAITYEHQRELPTIKSTNYLMGVWLQPLLKEKRVNDVLYCNNGIISEFPRANIFIITKDKEVHTPVNNILYGVTRKKVMSLAKESLVTLEKDITVNDVLNADEVFLTSTTKKIMPVVKINDVVIGNGKPGKITSELFSKFLLLENRSM